MNDPTPVRHPIAFHVITALLAAFFVIGAKDAWTAVGRAETWLQLLDLAGQVAYAALALAVVVLRLAKRPQARRVLWWWVGVLIWTAFVAPLAWGGTGVMASISVALASGAVGGVILYVDYWAQGGRRAHARHADRGTG